MDNKQEIYKEILKLKGLLCCIDEDKYMRKDEYIQSAVKDLYSGRLRALENELRERGE